MPSVKCKICDDGIPQHEQEYRITHILRGTAMGIAIGYILLTASVLAMVGSVPVLLDSGLVERVLDGDEFGGMVAQHLAKTVHYVAMVLVPLSIVGGLLGSFLIRKKGIFKCPHCGAVVARSSVN
jgi:hypothetical protein